MVLLNCIHSRYTALLFFTASLRRCQGPIWPCLCCIQPNPSFSSWWRTTNVPHTSRSPPHYSSSRLSRETSSFTSSMTILQRQVFCRFWSYKEISWMLCCRIFPTEAISFAFPVVLLLSSHCIFLGLSLSSTPLFLRALLAPLRLFICFVTFGQLPCFQGDYLNLFPIIPIQSASCFYRIS